MNPWLTLIWEKTKASILTSNSNYLSLCWGTLIRLEVLGFLFKATGWTKMFLCLMLRFKAALNSREPLHRHSLLFMLMTCLQLRTLSTREVESSHSLMILFLILSSVELSRPKTCSWAKLINKKLSQQPPTLQTYVLLRLKAERALVLRIPLLFLKEELRELPQPRIIPRKQFIVNIMILKRNSNQRRTQNHWVESQEVTWKIL